MKKYLVLSTFDSPAGGQAFSVYQSLVEKGETAFFLPMIRQYTNHNAFFIDAKNGYGIKRALYAMMIRLQRWGLYTRRAVFHSYVNSLMKGMSAEQILMHTPFTPDVIIMGWCDGYVSYKTLQELYKLTGARVIIPMIDGFLLGGGCHYPCDCPQYTSGCTQCPSLRIKALARKEYALKNRVLASIPLTIVGTGYDLERARKVPFLKGKLLIKSVGAPQIPFVLEKDKARLHFNIPEDHFVIMFGAVDVLNERKGFNVLLQALRSFGDDVSLAKPVTLLVLGVLNQPISLNNINVISLGILPLDELYKAYYATDIYVSPSLEDSGPYMVNYSIACGRPVVSFGIGIALDLVITGETGYIAQYNDSNDLSNGISTFYNMESNELFAYQKRCLKMMASYRETELQMFDKVFREC